MGISSFLALFKGEFTILLKSLQIKLPIVGVLQLGQSAHFYLGAPFVAGPASARFAAHIGDGFVLSYFFDEKSNGNMQYLSSFCFSISH